jgi:hypothetical protein
MTCTRCGGVLHVIQTMHPADLSPARRRMAKRVTQEATVYVVRRRRCVSCEQIVHTVEVEISALAPAP